MIRTPMDGNGPLPPEDTTTAPGMLYSNELADRVEREAREATRLPWWFWEAGAIIFVVAVASSAAWPMGLAS